MTGRRRARYHRQVMDSTSVTVSPQPVAPAVETSGSLKLFVGFLVVATLALSVLVTLLATENRRLKNALAQAAAPVIPASLLVGRSLGPLTVTDRSGAQTTLSFTGQAPATLVLIIAGSCSHCENTIPVWERALERASNPRLRITCLQIDVPSPEALEKLTQPWPLYGVVRDRGEWVAELPMVPAAFLLDADGVITHSWLGELDDRKAEEFMFAMIGAGMGEAPVISGG